MKLLFLAISVLFTSNIFAQAYLGKNEATLLYSLKKAKGNDIGEITRAYSSDGTLILGWPNYKMKYYEIVYFNKQGVVMVEAIQPNNEQIFKYLIQIYDEAAVKISSTEWKWYYKGKTYRVTTIYGESDGYTFYTSLWD